MISFPLSIVCIHPAYRSLSMGFRIRGVCEAVRRKSAKYCALSPQELPLSNRPTRPSPALGLYLCRSNNLRFDLHRCTGGLPPTQAVVPEASSLLINIKSANHCDEMHARSMITCRNIAIRGLSIGKYCQRSLLSASSQRALLTTNIFNYRSNMLT